MFNRGVIINAEIFFFAILIIRPELAVREVYISRNSRDRTNATNFKGDFESSGKSSSSI